MLTSVPMKPRYAAPNPVTAEGWQLQTVTGPSRLFGANGLRTGPDGRVYVAQVTGSQISALDLDTGTLEVVSPKGGDIIAPDDVAFGTDGTLYATEVMDGRVSARDTAGHTRVLRDDLPCANGITVHDGRLFVGECRDGGRLMELPLDGGEPRVLLDNLGILELFSTAESLDQAEAAEPVEAGEAPDKTELTRTSLEAHQTLTDANPENGAKFKEVTRFLEEDLKQQEAADSSD